MEARSARTSGVGPATSGRGAPLTRISPEAGGSEIVFANKSLLYGSCFQLAMLLGASGSSRSIRWKSRRPSDDPSTSNSPPRVEASAGRLSRRLSECARKIGPVHVFPSNEAIYSLHTVPSGFHQIGNELRNAIHIRPDESMWRRGMVLRGASKFAAALLGLRSLASFGFGVSHASESFWRVVESALTDGMRGTDAPGITEPQSIGVFTARPSVSNPIRRMARP